MTSKDLEICIREAKNEDLSNLDEIEKLSFDQPYSRSILAWLIFDPEVKVFVAEYKGMIVGYAAGITYNEEGHVISIAVHPNFRRKGIATALLAQLIEFLKKKSVKKIILEVSIDNLPALNFYRKMGFKISRKLRNYYGDSRDAYLMELIVKE